MVKVVLHSLRTNDDFQNGRQHAADGHYWVGMYPRSGNFCTMFLPVSLPVQYVQRTQEQQ